MRKFNSVLTAAILIFLIIHAGLGAFALIGVGHVNFKAAAWILTFLVMIHAGIGVISTVQSLLAWKKTGAPYLKQNALFWARRISGFAILLFLFLHFGAFSYKTYGVYRLKKFTLFKMISHILLALSLLIHIITSVKPMLIGFGIKSLKERAPEILFFLSVIMLFVAAAFVIYYLRWNVL